MTERVPKRIRLPFRPPVAIGSDSVIKLAAGDYWRVDRATFENGRRSGVYLHISPLQPFEVTTGWGELAVDLTEIDGVTVEEVA